MTAYELRSYPGNAAETKLASDITNAALSVPAVSTAGYADGTSGPAYFIVDYDNSKAEKIRYTSLAGNSFIVPAGGRGQDGTTAVAHSAGAKIRAVWTATDAGEANKAAHYTVGQVTTKGDLVAGTGANALGRVAAGADNTVLVADSTQTTGVKWTTALVGPSLVNPTTGGTVLTTTGIGGNGVQVTPGAAASLGLLVQGLVSQVGALIRAKLGTSQTGRFVEFLDQSNVTVFAMEADGSVAGTSVLAADRTAWTSYTPTFTNCTSPTGDFYYKLIGKTLHLRGFFTGGTATALGTIAVSLPASLTAAAGSAGVKQFVTGRAGSSNDVWTATQAASTLVTGNGFNAGAALNPSGFTGVIEVA